MKARAVHKTQLFRVKGLRWVAAETTQADRPLMQAAVLGAKYLVWRIREKGGVWTSWRWTYETERGPEAMRTGFATAAAAKAAAERDWEMRLREVLVPAGQRAGKGGVK